MGIMVPKDLASKFQFIYNQQKIFSEQQASKLNKFCSELAVLKAQFATDCSIDVSNSQSNCRNCGFRIKDQSDWTGTTKCFDWI
jgi:hypothetical protein